MAGNLTINEYYLAKGALNQKVIFTYDANGGAFPAPSTLTATPNADSTIVLKRITMRHSGTGAGNDPLYILFLDNIGLVCGFSAVAGKTTLDALGTGEPWWALTKGSPLLMYAGGAIGPPPNGAVTGVLVIEVDYCIIPIFGTP